ASVAPLQVPSGVPVQAGAHAQPPIAVQAWYESAAPHDSPATAALPVQEPRSMHPELPLQSCPPSASQGSGVPEQVPVWLPGPTAKPPPPLGFSSTPGQWSHPPTNRMTSVVA